ncbi:MAG: DUF5723 family protein [Flavobacteriales bacterium]
MKQLLLISLFSLFSIFLFGQDNLGIAGSSRAPINTVYNNPSSIVDSRAFLDIQLVGASVFARNNFVYLPGGSLNRAALEQLKEPGYNLGRNSYRAYSQVKVGGPSFYFPIKQHAFAVTSAVRTVVDARGINEPLGNYLVNGFQYRPQMGVQQQVKDLRTHALSWAEVGVTYGTIISKRGDMITQGAVSLKRLWGIAGVGLRIDDWTYTVIDSTQMQTTSFAGEYGFNDPMRDGFNWNNGKGFAFDLGITFKQRFKSSEGYVPYDPCTDGDYRYRLGFSLLDIGRIKFTPPTYRNIFDENEQSQWDNFAGTQVNDLSDIDSLLTEGLGAAQSNADFLKFTMMLPGAFSAQYDYNFGHGIYVYSVLTAGIPWKGRLGVQRASYLGVAPRFESKRFEVSVPITLYEFRQPMAGLALRLNSIVIGSDDLLAIVSKKDVYGADFYFSLKITTFRHWKCRSKKQKKAPRVRRNSFEPVPCPTW